MLELPWDNQRCTTCKERGLRQDAGLPASPPVVLDYSRRTRENDSEDRRKREQGQTFGPLRKQKAWVESTPHVLWVARPRANFKRRSPDDHRCILEVCEQIASFIISNVKGIELSDPDVLRCAERQRGLCARRCWSLSLAKKCLVSVYRSLGRSMLLTLSLW